jgi:hypothetical protein
MCLSLMVSEREIYRMKNKYEPSVICWKKKKNNKSFVKLSFYGLDIGKDLEEIFDLLRLIKINTWLIKNFFDCKQLVFSFIQSGMSSELHKQLKNLSMR